MTSEAKGLVSIALYSVLADSHQGTVAIPGDSVVAIGIVESVASPVKYLP
jgi:hypothetical protein